MSGNSASVVEAKTDVRNTVSNSCANRKVYQRYVTCWNFRQLLIIVVDDKRDNNANRGECNNPPDEVDQDLYIVARASSGISACATFSGSLTALISGFPIGQLITLLFSSLGRFRDDYSVNITSAQQREDSCSDMSSKAPRSEGWRRASQEFVV